MFRQKILFLKRVLRQRLNQRGFSLVELMVVVAIIGILASIAIPNFQRFQRKARQSEPKSVLGGMFTSQRVFIAEWGFGSSDLTQMGFELEEGGQPLYNTGWADNEKSGDWNAADPAGANIAQYRGPGIGTVDANSKQLLSTITTITQDIQSSFPGNPINCACDSSATPTCTSCAPNTTGTGCDPTPSGSACIQTNGLKPPGSGGDNFNNISFTIGSIGDIGGGQADAWTIDHRKELRNTQDGL